MRSIFGRLAVFVTLVVNARSGESLYMAPGKERTALDGFFKSLSAEQRLSIHCIGIDRRNAYRVSALANIPDIHICYDPYHLIANMNAVVDKMRRAAIRGASYEDLQLLKDSRYILLKSPESLDATGEATPRELMARNRKLHTAYALKEELRAVFRQRHEHVATWSMIRWVRMAIASTISRIMQFARGVAKALPDVLNTIRCRMNSAKIESMNVSIQRIVSKSCGLQDVPDLFAKLRQRFLLNRLIYRQKLMQGLNVRENFPNDIVTPLG